MHFKRIRVQQLYFLIYSSLKKRKRELTCRQSIKTASTEVRSSTDVTRFTSAYIKLPRKGEGKESIRLNDYVQHEKYEQNINPSVIQNNTYCWADPCDEPRCKHQPFRSNQIQYASNNLSNEGAKETDENSVEWTWQSVSRSATEYDRTQISFFPMVLYLKHENLSSKMISSHWS